MPTYKGVRAAEPLTPMQTLEAALQWYAQAEKTLREAQLAEGYLLPQGDVSTHYHNYHLWAETSRKLAASLNHELRQQYDERLGVLLGTFRCEGKILTVYYTGEGEELQVRTVSETYWLFVKQLEDLDFRPGQDIFWNTSFVYGPAPEGGNMVRAMLRRPSNEEIAGLKEQLAGG